MNTHTLKRLSQIYPELSRRVRKGILMAETLGYIIEIDQGLRTWPEQQGLWQQGRNSDGTYVDEVHHTGVVTYAQAGDSYHNYGLAVDFAPFEDGEPIWKADHPGYAKFIEICESMGLVSGSRWPKFKKDYDHLQLTGRFPEGMPDSYCKQLFRDHGLTAVWSEVDLALGITSEIVTT